MRRYIPLLVALLGAAVVRFGFRPEPEAPPDPHAADIAAAVVVPQFAVGDKVRCHGAGSAWDGRGGVVVAVAVNPEGCHRVDIAGTEYVIPPYYLTPLPPGW